MFGSQVDGSLRFDTRVDSSGFNTGVKNLGSSLGKLRNSLFRVASAVGIAFSVTAVVNFGKTCINTATEVENAWVGLNSIINAQGKSFDNAKKFIQEYVSDGLVPLKNAVTAYKNLSLRGYSEEQIEAVMNSLKNSATYARQSQYTLGDAISTATEGLKNENSILVDNAGVTKNVAKMWEEYAKKLGVSYTSLTKEQKIQAEVNGILEETKFQMGDAAKYSNTYSGQLARLSASFTTLKTKIGNILKVIVSNFLPYINNAISAVEKLADKVTALFNSWGIQTDVVDSLAGITDTATDSTDSLTDSIDETSEATENLKNQLAGFDKLNVLSQDDGDDSASSNTATIADLSTVSNGIDTTATKENINKIANIFSGLISVFDDIKKAFVKAWNTDNLGEQVIQSYIYGWNSLLDLIDEVGETFSEVWNDGTGEKIWSNILKIIENVNNIIGLLSEKLKVAWRKNKTGKKIWEDILGIIEDITELFEDLSEITLDWLKGLDFSYLLTSVEKLTASFKKLLKALGNKFKTVYENILLPLAEWSIEEAVPKLVEAFANALDLIAKVIDAISPNVLNALASALVGIGTALLVFKTGQTIANGITSITKSIQIFASLISSHPMLIAAGIIAGITTAIITFNKLKWSTSEAGKFAKEIDRIEGELELTTSKIEESLENTFKNLDSMYADNALIDTYQERLNELISEAELSPEEQTELKTIVTYFSDNVDGFKETWDNYVGISDNGKVELKGDLSEIQTELNNTIDEYQRLANVQAVSDLYSENIKTKITAQKELAEISKEVQKQRQIAGEASEAAQNAWDNGGNYIGLHETALAEAEKLEELEQKYKNAQATVDNLTSTNQDLSNVLGVLNGDFSDATSVMMAYNAGMIDAQTITESQYGTLEALKMYAQDEAGKTAENIVIGFTKGIEDGQVDFETAMGEMATSGLSAVDEVMDINSPSKEMYKRSGFIVAGAVNGVRDNQQTLLSTFSNLFSNIKNIFGTLPDWFYDTFSNAWQAVKKVFSSGGTVFEGIKGGILSELKSIINILIDGINNVITQPFNALNNALDNIRNFDFGGLKPFEGITTINIPQIPKLATGTVVPANYGEFTAILGDNKREPEIVSPVSAMKQAMREVLEEMGAIGSFSNVEYRFVAELNGKPLFEEIVTQDKIDRKRHNGRSRLGTVR